MGFIAIGDIHGCAKTLDLLLETLAPTEDDRLIFIGDYVDRGPDSKGVIDRLIALQENVKCIFLKGNHEELMLGYLHEGEYGIWAANGGVTTLDSYTRADGRTEIPEDHMHFLRNLRIMFETREFFFVHAGLKPQLTVAENVSERDEFVFLWERSHLKASHLPWEKTVVCGHTPVAEPVNRDRLINIDTGCVYFDRPGMGRLTAVRLPEREFVSVPFAD